jgi:hypothetical protein
VGALTAVSAADVLVAVARPDRCTAQCDRGERGTDQARAQPTCDREWRYHSARSRIVDG